MIFKLFNSSPTTKVCINIRHKHVNIMHVIKNPKRNQSLDLEGDLEGEMGRFGGGDGGGDGGIWRGIWRGDGGIVNINIRNKHVNTGFR